MLKIFLSSTYRDLADPRSKILQQLNSAFKGVGMEEFIPDGSDSQEVCIGNLKKMKENGVVIFLISPYYGSPIESCSLKAECKADCSMKGEGHISYTHCEYKTTKAEGILHQTYLIAKGWDDPEVKKEALQFKEEIGKEYLGFVDVEDPNLVELICNNLATKIIEWHTKDKLDFTLFVDREKKLNEIIENIDGKVEVWGVGGVGKTALIEVALLIQKLKGKRILTIGTPKTYASGSGFKDFRDKAEEAQYVADSPDQITIYDVINAFANVKLISNVDEILRMPSNEKILHLSKIVRKEKNLIFFIDDFHLATEEVVEIAKSVDHIIISSRKNSYIAKAIYLDGIDEEDREDLINLYSEGPLPTNVKNLVADIAEGHPISTLLLVKNYQRINFDNLKDFNLKIANQGQIDDFFRRVIEEIFSSNDIALKLLEDMSILNTDLDTNIDRKSVEKSYPSEDINNQFNELIDTGMLKKKEGSQTAYEFCFKHIQDALEDKAPTKSHERAILYYEKKEEILREKYMIDDKVEILYHKVTLNPTEQSMYELLSLKKGIYPVHYGFKRLIHVGEDLKFSVSERNKSSIALMLGNMYSDLKRFKEAEMMYLDALNIRKELAEQCPDVHLPDVLGTQNNLGLLYVNLNRYKEAEILYLDVLNSYKRLAKQNPDAFIPDLARIQHNLGFLYANLHRFEEAETMYLDALNIRKELAEQYPEVYLPALADTQNNLGALYAVLHRFEEAETMYLDALNIRKKLVEQSPEVYLQAFADTLNNLGLLYYNLQRFEEVKTIYLDALDIYNGLAEQSPDAYLFSVANTQNNLGALYAVLHRFEEAETMYLNALDVFKRLVKYSPDAYMPDVAMSQNNLGILYSKLERLEEAENMYLDALDIYKKLAEQTSNAYLSYVAKIQNNLAILYKNLKRFSEAETMFINTLNLKKRLAKQNPDAYLPLVAHTHHNLGNLYFDLNRLKESETMYLKALDVFEKLVKQSPNAYLPFVAMTQNNLGKLYSEVKRFEEAETMYLNALNVFKRLVERSPDAYQPNVAMTQNNLGKLYSEVKRFEEAETMYLNALNVFKRLVERSLDTYQPNVAITQNDLGALYMNMKRYKESNNCFNEVLNSDPKDSSAWYNKACIESLRNNKEKALEYLAKAIDLDQKYIDMAKSDEDFNNIRDSKEFKELIGE